MAATIMLERILKGDKTRFTVYVPKTLAKRVRLWALEHEQTISFVVAKALEAYMKDE